MNARYEAYKFFHEHAGYRVGHSAEDALALARAEQTLNEALELGIAKLRWEDEDGWTYGDLGDVWTEDQMREKFDSNEWTGPFIAAIDLEDDRYTASVGMVILGPQLGDPYARVIGAELAYEILDDLRQAIGDARDAATGLEG